MVADLKRHEDGSTGMLQATWAYPLYEDLSGDNASLDNLDNEEKTTRSVRLSTFTPMDAIYTRIRNSTMDAIIYED